MPTTDMDDIAQTLKLLGDKTRLTIMKLLQYKECCVCELVEIIQMSQPSISQHLRKLKDAGLVKESRKGQWVFYSLSQNTKYGELIEQLIAFVPAQDHEFEVLEKQGLIMMCD